MYIVPIYCIDHFENFLNQFADMSIVFYVYFSHFIFIFFSHLFVAFFCSIFFFVCFCCSRKRDRLFLFFTYYSLFLYALSKTLSLSQLCIFVLKWNLQWNTKWELVAILFIWIAFKLNCCKVIFFFFIRFITNVFGIVCAWVVFLRVRITSAKRTDDFHFKHLS